MGARRPGGRFRRSLLLREASVVVDGLERTWRLAPGPTPTAPLLVMLHGAGGSGPGAAALTGLATRGPAAGFAVAFPDGWNRVWNDRRGPPAVTGRETVDDVAFLAAMVGRLAADGVADPGAVSYVGMSNGGFLAERLARHALLPLLGIVLVTASATVSSRQEMPRPARPTAVVMFCGTADPLVAYRGGPIGAPGRLAERRPRASGRGTAVAVEEVAADWVAANGLPPTPDVRAVDVADGDLPVTILRWRSPGRPPVSLYRVEGGGHTWPGGAQYLPRRLIGPVATGLDATGILLDALRSGLRR